MSVTSGVKVTLGMELLGHCNHCLWERRLVTDQLVRRKFFNHPVYGYVTYEEAAWLDVKGHNCKLHVAARERVQALMRGVDEYL